MRPAALFAYGFRPFFLATGVYAPLGVAAWLWMYVRGSSVFAEIPPRLWHGHEMVFGFIGAAIAGFLLTAVPSWTGARGFAGRPLVLLLCAWLAGRVAFATAAWLPLPALALCELVFLPGLALLVAPPLLRARNRNAPLLFVLAALWVTDALFLFALASDDARLATGALRAAINIVLLLVTVIGGRIVPTFTANALRQHGIAAEVRTTKWNEAVVIGAMAAAIVVDASAPDSRVAAGVAGIAAVGQAWRLAGWRTLRTLREPIVWVLHAGYAWLPVGLALKAIHLMSALPWAAQWLHALTVGAASTMILAVMTRAALGHTGRPLAVANAIAVAYVLLGGAALVRVFGAVLVPTHAVWMLLASGALWIIAFALFLVVYAPILTQPRVDARPG